MQFDLLSHVATLLPVRKRHFLQGERALFGHSVLDDADVAVGAVADGRFAVFFEISDVFFGFKTNHLSR